MTREEFINKAIECRKIGLSQANAPAWCISMEESCDECPAGYDGLCDAEGIYIDEIIRLREEKAEKVETNLEHYFKDKQDEDYHGWFDENRLVLEGEYEIMQIFNAPQSLNDIVDWLLSPYEQPKKYQMMQFEYDLLFAYRENYYENWAIEQLVLLSYMKSLGYFKNVPTDIRIKYILENAEVVEE